VWNAYLFTILFKYFQEVFMKVNCFLLVASMAFAISCSSGGDEELAYTYGSFIDTRDGQTYKTIEIGNHIWLANNLNYAASDSRCYNDAPANCTKYGRLYNLATAKTACPADWRLPIKEEWEALINVVGGSSTAGKHLKAKSGWAGGGNGEDTYGFAALPGGGYYSNGNLNGNFLNADVYGSWWSGSEYGINSAYYLNINYSIDYASLEYYDKSNLFSVRCIKDAIPAGSSSSNGTTGGNTVDLSAQLSGVSMQVYMNNVEYNGNGDIKIVLDPDTLPAGKIQNGKITLSLPETIDSKYLEEIENPCEEDYKSCDSNVSYTNDLASADAEFHAIIPGKNCHIRLYSIGREANFVYFSKAGNIEGTLTVVSEGENGDRTMTATYDINILNGWNVSWTTINSSTEDSINASVATSATQSVKNNVKWETSNCRDI
jgi:uncharacterized protein (TIGR02145 family)